MNNLEIKKIDFNHSEILYNLLIKENKEYIKYFTPFDLDNYYNIFNKLKEVKNDLYYGIFINNLLIGIFMMRGFDEEYEIPCFGVYISSKYSRMGILKIILNYCHSLCKINNIEKMMLKVHINNIIAIKSYEKFGFEFSHLQNDNMIYYKKIN